MALRTTGPDVGERIGHLRVRDEQGEWLTLADLPGEMLAIDVFRGHW